MSGSECYESLRTNFKDCWDEIKQIINNGYVEINPGHNVPVEIFLGGDYKVNFYRCTVYIEGATTVQHRGMHTMNVRCRISLQDRGDISSCKE